MDFTLDPDQQALADLTARITGDRSTPARLAELEAAPERFDRVLWRDLGAAGLLCPALPADAGGLGMGMVGTALVLAAYGEHLPYVPLPWHAVAALALGAFGDAAARDRWLGPALAGDLVLTCATVASAAGVHARPRPVTAASGDLAADVPARPGPPAGAGIRAAPGGDLAAVSGTVVGVPYGHVADLVLVPVGDELYLVEPGPVTTGESTNREVHAELVLADAPAARLAGVPPGWYDRRLAVAQAAVQAGVTAAALRRTAAYTSGRRQFGRPLSAFQGVALKAADGYVEAAGIRAAVLRAAWLLDTEPDEAAAEAEVLVAAWWAADAGQHCVHLTQHLHGGLGADVTYPIHRYFLWGKQIELLLGGASGLLARLGDVVVARDDVGDALRVP